MQLGLELLKAEFESTRRHGKPGAQLALWRRPMRRTVTLHLHTPDDIAQTRPHVGNDDWAVPIDIQMNGVAQKMMGVRY
jgi:hypothetical protein